MPIGIKRVKAGVYKVSKPYNVPKPKMDTAKATKATKKPVIPTGYSA